MKIIKTVNFTCKAYLHWSPNTHVHKPFLTNKYRNYCKCVLRGSLKKYANNLAVGRKTFLFKSNLIGAPERHKHSVLQVQFLRFNIIDKTKRHHSVKTERRHSVTFQSLFIQSTEWQVHFSDHSVTIQSPFRRLSVIFTLLFSIYSWSYKHYFFIYWILDIPE